MASNRVTLTYTINEIALAEAQRAAEAFAVAFDFMRPEAQAGDTVIVHACYGDLFGELKFVNEATGRTCVRFFDPVFGCWDEFCFASGLVETIIPGSAAAIKAVFITAEVQ